MRPRKIGVGKRSPDESLKSSLRPKKMRTLRWNGSRKSADGYGAEPQRLMGNAGDMMPACPSASAVTIFIALVNAKWGLL